LWRGKMPSKVEHLTKIVDVKEVEFFGKLTYNYGLESWTVKGEDIEAWLNKLNGNTVRLTIRNISSDDSEMLDGHDI
jgi:hypothetical protein